MSRAKVELIESSGGVFEVSVDGKLIYSKKASGVFPDEERLVEKIGGDAPRVTGQ